MLVTMLWMLYTQKKKIDLESLKESIYARPSICVYILAFEVQVAKEILHYAFIWPESIIITLSDIFKSNGRTIIFERSKQMALNCTCGNIIINHSSRSKMCFVEPPLALK